LGVAKLSRVSIVAPRSEYQQVLARVMGFGEYHLIEDTGQVFDAATEDLAVRAVRMYAQADQLVKDLGIPLEPGTIDIIFRGKKVSQFDFSAPNWLGLLSDAERELVPMYEELRAELSKRNELRKSLTETLTLLGAVAVIAELDIDLGILEKVRRLRIILAISPAKAIGELQRSLPDLIFVTRPLPKSQTLVLIAGPASEAGRIDKTLRALEIKPFTLPESTTKNPYVAYTELGKNLTSIQAELAVVELRLTEAKERDSEKLLAIRELTGIAQNTLGQVRKAGKLATMAVISGYVPSSEKGRFLDATHKWMAFVEDLDHSGSPDKIDVPTLLRNPGPTRSFEEITRNQGPPGRHEIDPTPIISLVFPIFFGMMFADLGHGLVLTAFGLLVIRRGYESLMKWGSIFTAAGISASIFGALFGEFFGFDLGRVLPIPKVLELVQRAGGPATLNQSAVLTLFLIALLIGIAHLTIAFSLDIYEASKAHETLQLITEKIPNLIFYWSGIGFAVAFIEAGYKFGGVLSTLLGQLSVAIVLPMAVYIALAKGVATAAGKMHEDSVAMTFVTGIIELIVKIAEFLANTISYARLAILLTVHAALLIILNNEVLPQPVYLAIPLLLIFNILIMLLEGLIVYIQDLRLHLYEWFTKFFTGYGIPFRPILPEQKRIQIKWPKV
jgi:V/A-type H+-transporting ATPase subunit I